jgi:hypothetical protein
MGNLLTEKVWVYTVLPIKEEGHTIGYCQIFRDGKGNKKTTLLNAIGDEIEIVEEEGGAIDE